MPFYTVEPEVAGEFGPRTVINHSVQPPQVVRLDYHFTNWSGDGIVEDTACFLVTRDLAAAIAGSGLAGARFADATTGLSSQGQGFNVRELPAWRWLQLTGTPYEDDFALNDDFLLVVSEPALELLRAHGLDYAEIDEAESE